MKEFLQTTKQAATGTFDNGDPVDISEAAAPDRFIALRFNETPPENEPEEEGGDDA